MGNKETIYICCYNLISNNFVTHDNNNIFKYWVLKPLHGYI